MKKLLIAVFCLVFTLMLSLSAFAKGTGKENTPKKLYLTNLYMVSYPNDVPFETVRAKLNMSSDDVIVGGDPSDFNDFNSGCGDSCNRIVLVEVYSEYAELAIRSAIAISAEQDDFVQNDFVGENGEKYYAVDCACYNECGDVDYYSIGSMNDGVDGGNKIVLYTTTDSRAGEPITQFDVINQTSALSDASNVVKTIYGDPCNFNDGVEDSNYVYLKIVRTAPLFGSAFDTTASVVAISVCSAVIIAACVFITVNKKKKPTVNAE